MYDNVLVLGTGSWGTAIAQVLSDNGKKVTMYGIDKEELDDINFNHRNSKYFDNILSPNIKATSFVTSDGSDLDVVIIAVPTKAVKSVLTIFRPILNACKPIIINLAKGYTDDEKSMYEVAGAVLGDWITDHYFSLLGPSHAEEVIDRKLTCVNLVPAKKTHVSSLIDLFTNDYFKVHLIEDLPAAEFYSGIKNVYALMSGILFGLSYGHNARAALLTYSLNEMNTLSRKFNYDNDSLFGLSGVGDLVVTCYSTDSRNFTAGTEIGKLNSYDKFQETNSKTVEGIRACKFIYNKMDAAGLDLPIIKAAYNILYNNKEPKLVIDKMFENFNNKI